MSEARYNTGEAFIARCEAESAAGNADFIGANMAKLEALIAHLQKEAYELSQLQYRARVVRDQHEPSAAERFRQ